MASEFLRRKWKVYFKCLDLDGNGYLDNEDSKIGRAAYTNFRYLDENVAKAAAEGFDNWYKEHVLRGRTYKIDVETYVEDLNKEYTADKKQFAERMRAMCKAISAVADLNKDGYMTQKEHAQLLKSIGQTKEDQANKLFASLNPINGKVPLLVLEDAWYDFLVNDDESNPGHVFTSLG